MTEILFAKLKIKRILGFESESKSFHSNDFQIDEFTHNFDSTQAINNMLWIAVPLNCVEVGALTAHGSLFVIKTGKSVRKERTWMATDSRRTNKLERRFDRMEGYQKAIMQQKIERKSRIKADSPLTTLMTETIFFTFCFCSILLMNRPGEWMGLMAPLMSRFSSSAHLLMTINSFLMILLSSTNKLLQLLDGFMVKSDPTFIPHKKSRNCNI